MNLANAQRLLRDLPDDAVVVDVGGGASPFPRADYVIDAMPFDAQGAGSHGDVHRELNVPPRYTRATWIRHDVCSREQWPVADKQFDYVVCSHLLEDIRDPLWVCSELQRIGKAGYVEVPSRIEEQSVGVEHPRYAGYYHHRWLICQEGGRLVFRHKPHNLHAVNDAIITRLGVGHRINPIYAVCAFEWTDELVATECMEFSEEAVIRELCAFSRASRTLPDLTVRVPLGWRSYLRRMAYRWRLSRGRT